MDPTAPGAILIVDAHPQRGLALASRLRGIGGSGGGAELGAIGVNGVNGLSVVVRDPTRFAESGPPEGDFDVAVFQLGAASGNAIAQAQHLLVRDSSTDVIFFADHECMELMIARALGIMRIISAEALADWLVGAAVPLVRCVRARRSLLEAQRRLPEIPSPGWSSTATVTPLPVAEQQFREAFLRQLLLHNPNRQAAARAAGVPYRTLCDMLKKVGIGAAPRSRRSDSRAALLNGGSPAGLKPLF